MEIAEMEQKVEKYLMVFSIFAFELGLPISHNLERDTCGYMSTVNVLTNTPKISPNTRRDILQINFPENDEINDKSAFMEILQVFGTLSHVDCSSVF